VALLPEVAEQLNINLQYRNPAEALSALNRSECDIASFHLPTCPQLARQILSHYQDLLSDGCHRLIRFVTRREGLMLRKGEHPQIRSLKNFSESGLRFISRDLHSGTRILFNLLLEQQGLSPKQCTSRSGTVTPPPSRSAHRSSRKRRGRRFGRETTHRCRAAIDARLPALRRSCAGNDLPV